ncbi:MAG: M4 family metallopeptidase [Candidatus Hydrogenedentes bacterium]|nr:M4 family metallopeptidase [Candidatus Hydrogenedentota bacterium]
MRKEGAVGTTFWCVAIIFCAAGAAVGQPANPDDIQGVLRTLQGPNTIDSPRQATTEDGYLSYVGAPSGNVFAPGKAVKGATSAEGVAKGFMSEHGKAFGVLDPNVDFKTVKSRTANGRNYVRLQQTYQGVPVFASSVTVQMDAQGGVEAVFSDIMRQADRVYSGTVSMIPEIDPNGAKASAISAVELEHPGLTYSATEPDIVVYKPSIIGAPGLAALAWDLTVSSAYESLAEKPVKERVLVDAHSGGVLLRYSLIHDAKDREIYDAENVPETSPGTLKRAEGDPESGIAEVDTAYDYYGDTYDFYFNEHGRDSINNAGMTMRATVRYCPSLLSCPYLNAFWNGSRMFFGDGFVVDDVVAHELTHGVTQYESDLVYAYEPGAINESFSDIWGEFVDLTNGKGDDSDAVRWLMGEEIPEIGAFRDMQDPPSMGNWLGITFYSMPDRYLGPGWYYGTEDSGGVHHNSGVGNKLCYLLTDGDKFNNFTVLPMGIPLVADLFYECQTNLLGPASGYSDLANAIIQAAQNLGLPPDDQTNIYNALFATEILQGEGPFLRHFRASGVAGSGNIALMWQNPEGITPFSGVDIRRRLDRFPDPNNPSDGTLVVSLTGGEEDFVDGPFSAGTEVFYTLYARAGSFGANVPQSARAVAGQEAASYLSEAFSSGTDMAQHQITYVPAVNYETAIDSGLPDSYVNYLNYQGTVSDDSEAKVAPPFDGTLPVAKEDIIQIPLADDGEIALYPYMSFPFFGEFYSKLYLSANGFLSPVASGIYDGPMDSTPTLANHFNKPRISFLFSDLDPSSGGEVWVRSLDDRLVITFENVPAFDESYVPGQQQNNTVQCELFHNGTIRVTYLGMTAKRAVLGISDGRGVPLDPADVIGGAPDPAVLSTDLTALSSPAELELLPIPPQFVTIGGTLTFTVLAASTVGTPEYSLVDAPAGASVNASTGAFTWDTTGFSEDVYTFQVCATAGGLEACQYVSVFLSHSTSLPTASNLTITPEEPRDSDSLVASYVYTHPSLPEGQSVIMWFQGNTLIPAYTNVTAVPPGATEPGQSWYFAVLPTTVYAGYDDYYWPIYLRGAFVKSDAVTILDDLKTDTNKDGFTNSADLQIVVGTLLGIQTEPKDTDVNSDGGTDVSDVQVVVNTILGGGE